MELTSIEHVMFARAALATGNPDALDALVRAGLSPHPLLRDGARRIVLDEARSRGLAVDAADDAPAAFADYTALRAAFSDARARGTAPALGAHPRWLVLAAAIRERWTGPIPAATAAAAARGTLDREDA